jgi:hypothetical protein
MSPRLLRAGPRLTRFYATRHGSASLKTGEASIPRVMIGSKGGDGDGRTPASYWCCTHVNLGYLIVVGS